MFFQFSLVIFFTLLSHTEAPNPDITVDEKEESILEGQLGTSLLQKNVEDTFSQSIPEGQLGTSLLEDASSSHQSIPEGQLGTSLLEDASSSHQTNESEALLGTSLLLTHDDISARAHLHSNPCDKVDNSCCKQEADIKESKNDCFQPFVFENHNDPYIFPDSDNELEDKEVHPFRFSRLLRTSTPKKRQLDNFPDYSMYLTEKHWMSESTYKEYYELDDSEMDVSKIFDQDYDDGNEIQTNENIPLSDSSFDLSTRRFCDQRVKKKRNVLLTKAIASSVMCLKKINSCKNYCLRGISLDFIKSARYRFWTKNYQQRIEWFHDKYSEKKNDRKKVSFTCDGGRTTCALCFRNLYKINKNFFYTWLKKFKKGAVSSGVKKVREISIESERAQDWLQDYANFRGDYMPDKEIILLPYKSRKIDIYKCYAGEQVENMRTPISSSNFYKMWENKFKNVKIKQTNSFSRCETCTSLTTRLEKTRDSQERMEIKRNIIVHNNRQMNERKYYKEKRNRAVENKRKYLSLIIDGMDQAKTNLPHFTGRRSKGIDVANLLATHVQGILNHGLNRFVTYVDINEYPHDSNLILNTILKELYQTRLIMNSFLPEILYIQADNCFRENKNHYMLGFCELLVWKKFFKEVHLSFLYVGHTHEDIDAAFSRIAEKLRKTEAETFPDLLNILPSAQQTQGLYDIKSWLNPHLNSITGHTTPLHFKFSLDINKKPVIEYKKNHYQSWKRMERPLLKSLPNTVPKIVLPIHFQKFKFDALEKNIGRCRYLFTDVQCESQFRWWKNYVKRLKETASSKEKLIEYSKKKCKMVATSSS